MSTSLIPYKHAPSSIVYVFILFTLSCGSPQLTVENAWVRPNVPPVKIAAAYLIIRNPTDHPVSLVAASTPVASITEMHAMSHDGNIMRMHKLDRLPIPANGTTSMQPGGNHLMLIDLHNDLQPGATVDISLTFDNGQTQIIHAPVKNNPSGQ